jgi:hypothetical protein
MVSEQMLGFWTLILNRAWMSINLLITITPTYKWGEGFAYGVASTQEGKTIMD